VKKIIVGMMAEVSKFPSEDFELVYGIDITCYMNSLENPGWFERYDRDTYYTKDSKETGKDGKPKNKKGELKNKAGDRKALHQNRENILRPDEAAVEQGQPRYRHEQHESGRGQDPGRVGSVQLRLGRGGGRWPKREGR